MANRFFWDDTIVALATANGVGAIAMIRLSGTQSISIVQTLLPKKKIDTAASHTLHFGLLRYKDEIIDEVVVSLYKGTASFTGEEMVEISCHGSPYIQQQIIDACIALGARLAKPGEFTQRAFLNGKLDLAQAEAVADIIASENKAAHQMAMQQMRGGVSQELAALREQLIQFTALVELELDFSDEDVEFANRSALKNLIASIKAKVKDLIGSFAYGNAIKNGVPVAIIGKPNAGKSTLLNALLKEERAIVSDIAGTTRDTIEEAMIVDGIRFRFIDTAGIRDTSDTIEAIGVERAKEKLQQAQVVIHLYEEDDSLLEELAPYLRDKTVFNLQSKIDEHQAVDYAGLKFKYPNYWHFGISVKEQTNLQLLTETLVAPYKEQAQQSSVVISHARHKEALDKTYEALLEVEQGMENGLSGDLLSYHLKDALYHLGSITGKIDVDKDILGAIFSKFCIGK